MPSGRRGHGLQPQARSPSPAESPASRAASAAPSKPVDRAGRRRASGRGVAGRWCHQDGRWGRQRLRRGRRPQSRRPAASSAIRHRQTMPATARHPRAASRASAAPRPAAVGGVGTAAGRHHRPAWPRRRAPRHQPRFDSGAERARAATAQDRCPARASSAARRYRSIAPYRSPRCSNVLRHLDQILTEPRPARVADAPWRSSCRTRCWAHHGQCRVLGYAGGEGAGLLATSARSGRRQRAPCRAPHDQDALRWWRRAG